MKRKKSATLPWVVMLSVLIPLSVHARETGSKSGDIQNDIHALEWLGNHPKGQFFRLTHINDNVDPHTNDTGYTAAYALTWGKPDYAKKHYTQVEFSSRLYTERTGEKEVIDGRTIYSEYFTEISRLDISREWASQGRDFRYALDLGVGIYNREEPIAPLMLWIQGGDDGQSGFHDLMDDNPGQKNISTGDIDPFAAISPSVIKNFYFGQKKIGKERYLLRFECGMEIKTQTDGNNLFLLTDAVLPVFQFSQGRIPRLKLSLLGGADAVLHKDGVKFWPEAGLELSISRFTIAYSVIFPLGDENTSDVDYFDDEPLMHLYMSVLF